MVSLESISNEIESIPWRKENLRKAFEELQVFSSALSFSLGWNDIEEYFDSIKKSIDQSFRELAEKQRQQQKKPSSENHPSNNEKGETRLAKELEEPEAPALRNLIKTNLLYISTIEKDVTAILRSSSNPAKLGLDVMSGLDDWRGREFLLGKLMQVAPEIKAPERGRAMELAGEWRKKIGALLCCKAQAAAFVKLVIAFGLVPDFEDDDLLEVVSKFAQKNQAIGLIEKLGLSEKIPTFIQKLISKSKHVAAVNFVLAFELGDKFPPVPMLEAFLKETEKAAQEILKSGNDSTKSKAKATEKELFAMRSVLKSIKKNKLEAEGLQESLGKRIAELEKQKAERKQIAAPGHPKPQQQPVNKRPQPAATAAAGPQKKKLKPLAQPAAAPFAQTSHVGPSSQSPRNPFPQITHVTPPLLASTSFPLVTSIGTLPEPAAASFPQITTPHAIAYWPVNSFIWLV